MRMRKYQCRKNPQQNNTDIIINQVMEEKFGKETSGKDKEGRNIQRPLGSKQEGVPRLLF